MIGLLLLLDNTIVIQNVKIFSTRLTDYIYQMQYIREHYKNILIKIEGNNTTDHIAMNILDVIKNNIFLQFSKQM
jgi:hypothetical protein